MSGYLEVFVLIGIAMAATALAFGAISPYASSLQGGSVTVSAASIRQGTYVAFETLTVFNSGGPAASGLTVTTSGVPGSATYCYSLVNPSTMVTLSSTCPSGSVNPGSVQISWPFPSGGSLMIELTISGSVFTLGSSYLVTVTTSVGSQASLEVQVIPA